MSAEAPVRSLILRLPGGQLVLPAAAVDEVLYAEPVDLPPADAPPWLLGELRLSAQVVPLLAFEALDGARAEPLAERAHAAVLRNLDPDGAPQRYALRTLAAPRVEQLDAATLQLAGDGRSDNALIAARVVVDGEEALLPDLDCLVDRLQRHWVGA